MKRGRPSAASLAVARPGFAQRPEPPADLTEDQADEWRAIAARMPADWFPRETHGALAQYCRHVVRARFLAKEIERFKPEWLSDPDGMKRLEALSKMADRESRTILALARSMRLTQQARLRPETAARQSEAAGLAGRPWD